MRDLGWGMAALVLATQASRKNMTRQEADGDLQGNRVQGKNIIDHLKLCC